MCVGYDLKGTLGAQDTRRDIKKTAGWTEVNRTRKFGELKKIKQNAIKRDLQMGHRLCVSFSNAYHRFEWGWKVQRMEEKDERKINEIFIRTENYSAILLATSTYTEKSTSSARTGTHLHIYKMLCFMLESQRSCRKAHRIKIVFVVGAAVAVALFSVFLPSFSVLFAIQ